MKFTVINKIEPIENETLESYLYRSGKVNDYNPMNWYVGLFNLEKKRNVNFLNDESKLREIADFFRLPYERICSMTINNRYNNVLYKYFSGAIYGANIPGIRVCPKCIIENDAMLLPWRNRIQTMCPKHHIFLIDSCPICGSLLSREAGCSNCGLRYDQMECSFLDNEISNTYADLSFKSLIGCPNDLLTSEQFPFSQITCSEFTNIVKNLGRILSIYDKVNLPEFLKRHYLHRKVADRIHRTYIMDNIHTSGCNTVRALSDWPNGWYATLDKVLIKEKVKRGVFVHKNFPLLICQLSANNKQYLLLWEEIKKYVSIENQQKESLNYWQFSVDFSQKKRYQINRELNPSIAKKHITHHLTISEAADYLGIKMDLLGILITNGYFSPRIQLVNGKVDDVFFTPEDLDNTLELIIEDIPICSYVNPNEVRYIFNKQQSVNIDGCPVINILDAILVDRIAAIRLQDDLNLQSICITKVELDFFISNYSEEYLMDPDEAAELCRCDIPTLMKLSNNGVIRSFLNPKTIDQNDRVYLVKSVVEFNNRYVALPKAAEIIGLSTIKIKNGIEKGLFSPISGPKIDGVDEYRFERIEILQWKKNHFSFDKFCDFVKIDKFELEKKIDQKVVKPIHELGNDPYWFSRSEALKIRDQVKIGKDLSRKFA